MQKRAIVWIGRENSGKDTHAAMLSSLGISMFSSGDYSRSMRSQDAKTELENGKLLDSGPIMYACKLFVVRHIGHEWIQLNGIPRKIDQREIFEFLKKRGFEPMVISFTTPKETCLARPPRPGREIEDSPEKREVRHQQYEECTLPMLDALPQLGIRPKYGNLLEIDNTNLTKRQTGARIMRFLGLDADVRELYPQTPKILSPSFSTLEPALVVA